MRSPIYVGSRTPRRLPKEAAFPVYALHFDDLNDYIAIPDSPSLYFWAGDFSIRFWMTMEASVNAGPSFMGQGDGVNDRFLFTYEKLNVRFDFAVKDAGVWTIDWHPAWAPLPGVWYYIVLTRKGNDWAFYVNGRLHASTNIVVALPNFAGDLMIGSRWDTTSNWGGKQNELSILTRALSPYEVMDSLLRGYSRAEAATVLNLRMEEGSGDFVYDSSGNGNHGHLGNGVIANMPSWVKVPKYQMLVEAGV